jgi:hypothetical protein
MIKKYTITKEKYLDLYPSPYAMRSDMRIREGNSFHFGRSSWPELPVYTLKRWSTRNIGASSALDNSKFGFYEILDLANLHEYRFLYLPHEYVKVEEVPGIVESLKPVLDKFMPGRWMTVMAAESDIEAGSEYLYLYYPEFTISNSLGETHIIRDMVVQLTFNEAGIKPELKGKRFSFTKQELGLGYSHSHLHVSQAQSTAFSTFCLGDSSHLKQYLNKLSKGCTPDQFEVLLVQIEQFLIWESIEGRPYISISTMFTNSVAITDPRLTQNVRIGLAAKFMEKLTPDLLFSLDDYHYVLNPGNKAKELFEIEKEVTKQAFVDGVLAFDKLYDFDTENGTYEADANRFRGQTLPAQVRSANFLPILSELKIAPHLYENAALAQRASVIKRLGQQDLLAIFNTVNELLTNSQKLNGQNSISEESNNTNHTKAAVASNATA